MGTLTSSNHFTVVNYYRFLAGLDAQMVGPARGLELIYENEVISFRDKNGHLVWIEALADETPQAKEYKDFLQYVKKGFLDFPEEGDLIDTNLKLARREFHLLLKNMSNEDLRAAYRFLEYVVDRDSEE